MDSTENLARITKSSFLGVIIPLFSHISRSLGPSYKVVSLSLYKSYLIKRNHPLNIFWRHCFWRILPVVRVLFLVVVRVLLLRAVHHRDRIFLFLIPFSFLGCVQL
jgi:hypothetical protein